MNGKAISSLLTPGHIGLLETQDFENRPPGPILEDFDVLLELIGHEGIPVTPTHLLQLNQLHTLNSRLSQPVLLGSKRPVQKSYPPINGLYLVLRSTGLVRIDNDKKPLLRLDPVAMESWRSLNRVERYFELLKAWWGRSSVETIGERAGGFTDHCLYKVIGMLKDLRQAQGVLTITQPYNAEMLKFNPGLHNLALLELFGFVRIRLLGPGVSKTWSPSEIRLTDWGDAILGSCVDLYFKKPMSGDGLPEEVKDYDFGMILDPLEYFEYWGRLVRPCIRGWQRELEIPDAEFQGGTHVFKVLLGKDCWRRLALSGEHDFALFANTILDAFDFDRDHLHMFSYKDPLGRTQKIFHQYMEYSDDPFDCDVNIGDILMHKGMTIGFLFDFGQSWRFGVVVEDIDADPSIETPAIIEKQGEAPEQYPQADWF